MHGEAVVPLRCTVEVIAGRKHGAG